jgi:hypothetical protein
MADERVVIETCGCGAKWEGSKFYAGERAEWREAHRGCREAFVLRGVRANIFGAAEPESPAERVERLEAELVEAEKAVERKRQEDGP